MQIIFNVAVIILLMYLKSEQNRTNKNCLELCKVVQEINLRQVQYNVEQVDINRKLKKKLNSQLNNRRGKI